MSTEELFVRVSNASVNWYTPTHTYTQLKEWMHKETCKHGINVHHYNYYVMENILEPELLFFNIYVYVLYYDVGLCQLS